MTLANASLLTRALFRHAYAHYEAFDRETPSPLVATLRHPQPGPGNDSPVYHQSSQVVDLLSDVDISVDEIDELIEMHGEQRRFRQGQAPAWDNAAAFRRKGSQLAPKISLATPCHTHTRARAHAIAILRPNAEVPRGSGGHCRYIHGVAPVRGVHCHVGLIRSCLCRCDRRDPPHPPAVTPLLGEQYIQQEFGVSLAGHSTDIGLLDMDMQHHSDGGNNGGLVQRAC